MQKKDWWKDAVVYQIYPRSFQDSNGDGVGDLNGIIPRLDYIRELGADTIWLCPVYASPNADNGYDISDYRAIQPEFGTMEDFDRLLAQIHQRGMRLVMDLVVNHTSDEHPWFQESRSGRNSPLRDYYIWRDGRNGGPPNNWNSWFGGPAWEYDAGTGQYYLHIFHRKQPDLNWNNPGLRREIYAMMAWWLNKGVDGFRMDVISLISKPNELPDGPGGDLSPFCVNGPHVHEYLREMNECVLSRYNAITVGECPGVSVEEAQKYAGYNRRELNMVFQFEHTALTDGPYGKWSDKKPDLQALKKVFYRWQSGLDGKAWNCLFWSNHDQPRAVSRFGSDLPEYRDLSAKMLCACLYLMQGTPYLYQGEELGMANAGFFDLGQNRDVESIHAYRALVDSGTVSKRKMLEYLAAVSRDNARTPMQWTDRAGAGFTTGEPWIPLGQNWRSANLSRELKNPDSVFFFYQKVLAFRKNNPVVKDGRFELVCPESDAVFAYLREGREKALLVICNFTASDVHFVPPEGWGGKEPVLTNYNGKAENDMLRPYEVAVLQKRLPRRPQ